MTIVIQVTTITTTEAIAAAAIAEGDMTQVVSIKEAQTDMEIIMIAMLLTEGVRVQETMTTMMIVVHVLLHR